MLGKSWEDLRADDAQSRGVTGSCKENEGGKPLGRLYLMSKGQSKWASMHLWEDEIHLRMSRGIIKITWND